MYTGVRAYVYTTSELTFEVRGRGRFGGIFQKSKAFENFGLKQLQTKETSVFRILDEKVADTNGRSLPFAGADRQWRQVQRNENRTPRPWNWTDAVRFIELFSLPSSSLFTQFPLSTKSFLIVMLGRYGQTGGRRDTTFQGVI